VTRPPATGHQGGSRRHADAAAGPHGSGGIRRYVATHLASHQVSRVTYGSIIGLALVVALEAHPPAPAAVIASLLGTAIAVGLAELYSELVELEVGGHRKTRRADVRHASADIGAVAIGIAFPAVFFVLAAVGVFRDETAFTVAKWSGLGLIGLYGFVGARVSGAGLVGSFLQASGIALIGGVLIALKALVH
jgi:hypothetical protein